MNDQDPYAKLRAPLPTPAEEICECLQKHPLKLMSALGANPVHCLDCNLEVAPETLGFDPGMVEAIACWHSVYAAIDQLWLDSAEYEDWAKGELGNIRSPVNVRGLAVRAKVDAIRRCYYWLFQDESVDIFEPITHCPNCGEPLEPCPNGIFAQLVCEKCSIVTAGKEEFDL